MQMDLAFFVLIFGLKVLRLIEQMKFVVVPTVKYLIVVVVVVVVVVVDDEVLVQSLSIFVDCFEYELIVVNKTEVVVVSWLKVVVVNWLKVVVG
eukprot:CAMPEP_0201545384 /NCGR_PEP_ID=MMETSP0173_2-20130828/1919_1 /ASSEMBLY_ACC=CAM_ASM_000268 /TAXON_ID=218659 /ORGANISM="Vexillifera sp., Strain DIVA3 564/2" /LENGTH=93 /DNA_ID=CAMNT_0047953777 /DNA_START=59 /DNA_END=336 /DNA_ORIENTATION=+